MLTKLLIQYDVEEVVEEGLNITGCGKRAIYDYFDIFCELEQQIKGRSKENLLNEFRSLIDQFTFSIHDKLR